MLTNLLPFILLIILIFYLSTFLHEVGHAVMAWLNGLVVTAFGLGLGPPFLVVKLGGTRIYFGCQQSYQGFAWALYPKIYSKRRAEIAMSLGGPLANLLIALVAGVLWYALPWGNTIFGWIAIINLFSGIFNLVPFSFRLEKFSMCSDGALILQTLQRGQATLPAPVTVQMVKSLDGFWEGIGDARTKRGYLLAGSLAWLQLGSTERAETLCASAESMTQVGPPSLCALASVVRGWVACAKGEFESSAAALEGANKAFTKLDDEGGLLLVHLGQAELALQKGELSEAEARLKSLKSHKIFATHLLPRVAFLAQKLRLLVASHSEVEIEPLLEEYNFLRRRYAAPEFDLYIYRTAANFYQKQMDLPAAEGAYQRALKAARTLYFQFADPTDQIHFRQCQETLLTEAESCLRELDKVKEAEKLSLLFPSPEETLLQQSKRKEQRNRAYTVVGRFGVLMNLMLGLGLIVATGLFTRKVEEWAVYPAAYGCLLVIFALLAGVVDLGAFLLGGLSPKLRQSGGTLVLLAVAPWIVILPRLAGFSFR